MKRDHGRMQRLQRVFEVQEEVARARWAAAERAAQDAELEARAHGAELARSRAELSERFAAGRVDPELLIALHSELDRVEGRVRNQHERALTLRFQADQERPAWLERRVAARGVSILVDRARESEAKEAEDLAARASDEQSSRRAHARPVPQREMRPR